MGEMKVEMDRAGEPSVDRCQTMSNGVKRWVSNIECRISGVEYRMMGRKCRTMVKGTPSLGGVRG